MFGKVSTDQCQDTDHRQDLHQQSKSSSFLRTRLDTPAVDDEKQDNLNITIFQTLQTKQSTCQE